MNKIRAFFNTRIALYILLALFCLLLACLSNNYDYDLYARLIVGEHFFAKGWISYEDFLSYTPTHIWFDHEWGASVIFYAFFKIFGNFGLILIQAILMFFTVFFVIKTQQIQKHAYPPSLFFMIGFILLFNHQNPSIVRCHMFSFMFFSMLIYLLEKTRRFNSNMIWIMPIIFIFWNNIHGGVVSGLGMVFIYLIGELISRKPIRKYFSVLAVSIPLLVINPYGAEYLNFLLSANTMNREYICEWWAVFVQRHVIYYYPMFIAGVFTLGLVITNLLSHRKINLTKALALIVTTILGIMHVKLLALTLITVAALYYNDIIKLINKTSFKFLNRITYILVTLAILYIPFAHPNTAKTLPSKFPVQEVEFLKINKIKGNILTAFGLGSYVSYKLYPDNLIFMDGRYEEVYFNREFDNMINFNKANALWHKVLVDYPTEILMPEKIMPIYEKLQKHNDWEEVYTGNVCGIFLKKNRKTHKGDFLLPSNNLKYYQDREFENLGKFGE